MSAPFDRIFDSVYLDHMGRPPLNMKPALVRFPSEVLDRVDALVGPRNRPRFIREAVASELERRENNAHPTDKPSAKTQPT